jgi:hypothetical protein
LALLDELLLKKYWIKKIYKYSFFEFLGALVSMRQHKHVLVKVRWVWPKPDPITVGIANHKQLLDLIINGLDSLLYPDALNPIAF